MFIQTSLTSNLILVMNKKLMHILFHWYISVRSMERHVHQQTNQSEIMNVGRVTIHVPCPYLDSSILLFLIHNGILSERLTLERYTKMKWYWYKVLDMPKVSSHVLLIPRQHMLLISSVWTIGCVVSTSLLGCVLSTHKSFQCAFLPKKWVK